MLLSYWEKMYMENMRINVRQAHSDTYNGNPYIAFAGIMTGLLSVMN